MKFDKHDDLAEKPIEKKPKKRSKKVIIIAVITVVLLAGATAFYFLAWPSVKDKILPNADESSKEEDVEREQLNLPENIKEVDINKSIKDEDLGYNIIVQRVLYGVEFNEGASSYLSNYQGIVIEVRLENDSQYEGEINLDTFELASSGISIKSASDLFTESIAKYGLKELATAKRNEVSSGWLFFYAKKDANDISFRYSRPESEITFFDDRDAVTIEAKDFDVKL